eukprot:gene74-91_t
MEEIIQLAIGGNIQDITHSLSSDRSILHKSNSQGWTMLSGAALGGHKELACYLIDAGAELNVQDKEGRTPLHLACYRGHTKVGCTPLHYAAKHGQIRITQLLIESDAKIHIRDHWGLNALQWACINGHNDVIEALSDRGAILTPDPSVEGNSCTTTITSPISLLNAQLMECEAQRNKAEGRVREMECTLQELNHSFGEMSDRLQDSESRCKALEIQTQGISSKDTKKLFAVQSEVCSLEKQCKIFEGLYSETERQLTEVRDQVKRSEYRREQAETLLQQRDMALRESVCRCNELSEQLSDCQKELAGAEQKNSILDRTVSQLKRRLDAMGNSGSTSTTTSPNRTSNSNSNKGDGDNEVIESPLSQLESQLSGMVALLEESETVRGQLEIRVRELETAATETRSSPDHSGMSTMASKLTELLESSESREQELEDRNSQIKSELETCRGQLAAAEHSIAVMSTRVMALENEKTLLKMPLTAVQQTLDNEDKKEVVTLKQQLERTEEQRALLDKMFRDASQRASMNEANARLAVEQLQLSEKILIETKRWGQTLQSRVTASEIATETSKTDWVSEVNKVRSECDLRVKELLSTLEETQNELTSCQRKLAETTTRLTVSERERGLLGNVLLQNNIKAKKRIEELEEQLTASSGSTSGSISGSSREDLEIRCTEALCNLRQATDRLQAVEKSFESFRIETKEREMEGESLTLRLRAEIEELRLSLSISRHRHPDDSNTETNADSNTDTDGNLSESNLLAKKEFQELEKCLTNLSMKLSQAESDRDEITLLLGKTTSIAEAGESRIASLEGEAGLLAQRLTEAQTAMALQQRDLRVSAETVSVLREEVRVLSEQLFTTQSTLNVTKTSAQENQRTVLDLLQKVTAAQKDKKELSDQVTALSETVKVLEGERDDMKDVLHRINSASSSTASDAIQWQQRVTDLERQLSLATNGVMEANLTVDLLDKLGRTQAQCRDLQSQLDAMR